MFKNLNARKIIFILLGLLLLMQVFRIDKTNPPVVATEDFLAVTQAPAEVADMIRTSCYDCHSNESTYPWYTNIAPVSWWIKHHINEGREHLNFSTWGKYSLKKQHHKLEECEENIEEGEMPMSSYILMHPDAGLQGNKKLSLRDWFASIRKRQTEENSK